MSSKDLEELDHKKLAAHAQEGWNLAGHRARQWVEEEEKVKRLELQVGAMKPVVEAATILIEAEKKSTNAELRFDLDCLLNDLRIAVEKVTPNDSVIPELPDRIDGDGPQARGICAKCKRPMQFADGICFDCNGGNDPGD